MSIVYEGYGNVLNHHAQTITIPVNTVGVMGKGLALAARNRIQDLNSFYKGECTEGRIAIGRPAIYAVPDDVSGEKQVLLFPTKGHWKDDSKLEDIEKALQYLVDHIEQFNIKSLAMPPIGCGLGKLDYSKEIRPLLVKYLDPLEIDVYLLLRELN